MSIPPGFSGYGSSNRHSPRPSSSRQSSVRPSATPQLSPALEVNLRKVRWGEDQVFSQSQREDEEEDDEDVKDELEEDAGWNGHGSGVTLAITAARGKVGCCYYDGGVGKVYFLQDQGDSERWDLVTMSESRSSLEVRCSVVDPQLQFSSKSSRQLFSHPLPPTQASSRPSPPSSNPSPPPSTRPPQLLPPEKRSRFDSSIVHSESSIKDKEGLLSRSSRSSREGVIATEFASMTRAMMGWTVRGTRTLSGRGGTEGVPRCKEIRRGGTGNCAWRAF